MSKNDIELFEQWRADSCSRFPSDFIDARLLREQRKAAGFLNLKTQRGLKNIDLRQLIQGTLKLSGLARIGKRNAANIRVQCHNLPVKNLPQAFVGHRILQISDPHFNGDSNTTDNLIKAVAESDYDLCVLTGDYRFRSFGQTEQAIAGLEELMAVVNKQTVGILGNHDSLLMVPRMESMGISVLINERCTISKNDQHIDLIGVDDPSYYRMHDLQRAMGATGINQNDCTILLAHSPDLYQQASQHGIGAYLCGHTHGGQICLPGGFPIRRNVRAPSWSIAGGWCYQKMHGYTSVGAGCSIVEARFFCPPQITVHELIYEHLSETT